VVGERASRRHRAEHLESRHRQEQRSRHADASAAQVVIMSRSFVAT
jgi:hypothetical protein